MQDMTTDQVRARLVEWQRILNDRSAPAHLRSTARRGVARFTAELKSRQS